MYPFTEKFDTLKPRPGAGTRIIKSKILKALGATGVLQPFAQNTERLIERKILLQNTFSLNPSGGVTPPPPVGNGLLAGLLGYWKMTENNVNRVDATGNGWTATKTGGNV